MHEVLYRRFWSLGKVTKPLKFPPEPTLQNGGSNSAVAAVAHRGLRPALAVPVLAALAAVACRLRGSISEVAAHRRRKGRALAVLVTVLGVGAALGLPRFLRTRTRAEKEGKLWLEIMIQYSIVQK